MLVLSRKSGEEIFLGSGIKVEVLSIKGGRVSLGLSAPPEVSIKRAELLRQIGDEATERPANDSPASAEPATTRRWGSIRRRRL
jgi:carbon storage regulator